MSVMAARTSDQGARGLALGGTAVAVLADLFLLIWRNFDGSGFFFPFMHYWGAAVVWAIAVGLVVCGLATVLRPSWGFVTAALVFALAVAAFVLDTLGGFFFGTGAAITSGLLLVGAARVERAARRNADGR